MKKHGPNSGLLTQDNVWADGSYETAIFSLVERLQKHWLASLEGSANGALRRCFKLVVFQQSLQRI